jgi:hypothetical protein
MTLQKVVRVKAFDVFDTEIFYYLRRDTKAAVVQDLYWQLTDALYETVDDLCRHAVCVETAMKIKDS